MAPKLKVDLHTHSADDPKDYINFSNHELIDRAAAQGFDALSIANHDIISFDRDLEKYAEKKGVLLIPGTEMTFSGKHVVIINPPFRTVPPKQALEDLVRFKGEATLIIAPHPFYPGRRALRGRLYASLPFIDAIEFSFFYCRAINKNKKAVKLAREKSIPLIGNSDCHNFWQLGTTYSLVEAEKDILSIIRAVKEGKVEIRTSPLSMITMVRVAINFVLADKLRLPIRI